MKVGFLLLPFLLAVFMSSGYSYAEDEGGEVSKIADEYIEMFRRGEDFSRPIKGLVVDCVIDKRALAVLTKELSFGNSDVREKIVGLLVEIGFMANKDYPKDFVLRDPSIVKAISLAGFSKKDSATTDVARELRMNSTHDALKAYGDVYVEALKKSSKSEIWLLVAKAKPYQAKVVVDELASKSDPEVETEVKIAQAALGSSRLEDEFIGLAKVAADNSDGKALAEALKFLGWIGTRRSLQTVATYLRTPLTVNIGGVNIRSVRMDALEALYYNYLGQRVVHPNSIHSQEDYASAERFCKENLGVVFEGPLPPYFKNQPSPIPLPAR
ncbi:hypothetical protein [Uliginosibacterium aquaticum]|uniref:HEAT repeat domain-containing protein n=1 Tax=Uliginosibacterium aquaticum TaxID=2731212 RepID=A0ABX2IJU5_9RHOO|nr:hypothetical protein [Uliginosibacterium aquaticum]NSL57074.1 hypothetical protein [Uliginosibacterium aquaticum]